jgi:heat shock protein HtpX
MYWFSDKIAIATTRSKPVSEQEAPELYRIVRELAETNRMPMPRIHVSEMQQPNAFATGRNPEHAAVSVTRGILEILDERELRGVLAHELSHVANRDILVSSVAAAIGMSITFLARFAFWFGGGDDRDNNFGAIGMLVAWILAPLAAAIIQMAVSRSREYQADESGAILSKDPDALASALRKLEATAKQVPVPASVSPAEAHLFIVNPFRGRQASMSLANLFSTHPPTEARVARLAEIKRQIA